MAAFGAPNKPLHVMHIRKTGGSALKSALASEAKRNRVVLYPHHKKLSQLIEEGASNIVFAVRPTAQRFISGFYSRQRKGLPASFTEWRYHEEAAFQIFDHPNQLAEALYSNEQQDRAMARLAMFAIPNLRFGLDWWLESSKLLLAHRQRIGAILFTHMLIEDFTVLKSRYNLDETLSLPEDAKRSHRAPPGTSQVLSPLAIENLHRWYQTDQSILRTCADLRLSLMEGL